jgi:hypothetical protein
MPRGKAVVTVHLRSSNYHVHRFVSHPVTSGLILTKPTVNHELKFLPTNKKLLNFDYSQ